MLHWNSTYGEQSKAIEHAKKIKNISIFIKPDTIGKPIWENCAKILYDRNDSELNPYLMQLLEWIQDINWPGAWIIHDRLKEFSEVDKLSVSIKESVEKAINSDDEIWLERISELLVNENLKNNLPKETLNILKNLL